MTTHYIPFFTQAYPGLSVQRAVCGAYVDAETHDCEPTCDTCRAWLMQEAEPITEPKEKK